MWRHLVVRSVDHQGSPRYTNACNTVFASGVHRRMARCTAWRSLEPLGNHQLVDAPMFYKRTHCGKLIN